MVHNLDFAADIFNVVAVDEAARGDGLAGEEFFGLFVSDEVSDSELATA